MMLERSGVFPITKRRYLIIFISCLYPHTVLARCPGHTPQLYHICVMSRIGYFTFNGIYFVIETLFNLVPAKFELFHGIKEWISGVSGRDNAADSLSDMGHFTFSGMYLFI